MKERQEDEHWLDILKDSVDGYEAPVPESLYRRLEKEAGGHSLPVPDMPWRKRVGWLSAVAAVLVIFIGIGFLIKNSGLDEKQTLLVEKNGEQVPGKIEKPEESGYIEASGEQIAVIKRRPVIRSTVAAGNVVKQDTLFVPQESTGHQNENNPPSGATQKPASSGESGNPEDLREQARRWQELLAEEDPAGTHPRSTRFMSGIAFSGGNFISSASSGGNLDMRMYDVASPNIRPTDIPSRIYTEYAHKMPLNFSLSAGWNFKYGLSLETGLNYSLFMSDLRVAGRNSEEIRRQNLHYLGIPVKLNWTFFSGGGFSTYLGVRGEISKCIYANIGSDRIRVKDFQYAVGAFAGVQYTFGKHIGLYLEPGLSTYLNNDLKNVTYEVKYNNAVSSIPVESKITTTDYVFTIGLGIRFSY